MARTSKISLAELIDETCILAQMEIEPGSPVFEAFRAIGLDVPRATILSDSLNLRNSLLETGHFLTMIAGSVLRFGPERTRLKVLPVKVPRWPFPVAVITPKTAH